MKNASALALIAAASLLAAGCQLNSHAHAFVAMSAAPPTTRRGFSLGVARGVGAAAAVAAAAAGDPSAAGALVKGNAPPEGYRKGKGGGQGRCRERASGKRPYRGRPGLM